MKIAVIGSRTVTVDNLTPYLSEATEIVSGGANGVDTGAADYARKNKIPLTVFLPEYQRYGRAAPLVRNQKIVDYADKILAFWDGKSKGTQFVIRYAQKTKKECEVIVCS